MWIICLALADDSHEMSSLISSKKQKWLNTRVSSAVDVISALTI